MMINDDDGNGNFACVFECTIVNLATYRQFANAAWDWIIQSKDKTQITTNRNNDHVQVKFSSTGFSCTNLVPRVFSLSNMAAAGEKTLAHSRNHVTDLSTESGNLFKMAAKIKSERIWVRGLETGEKQTKWRQRQTQKKLKIWKNALTSHRNTVEWYSDLIFCSMTWV